MTIQDAPIYRYHPAINGLHRKWLKWTKKWVYDDYSRWQEDSEEFTESINVADMCTSRLVAGKGHAPVLDLDVPVHLVPSSTAGHNHLYIDVPMTWRQYKKVLRVLADAGILEKGYAEMSIKRGYSAVRMPWVRK